MLLGVVLHAAWIMTPVQWGSPIHDSDAGYLPFWLIWYIHMFRLQAFFLIAGFFAHLVLLRQGQWGFVKHRLIRIGIPFLIGWALIYPIWFIQDTWAGILRGRIQTDAGFWVAFQSQIGRSLSQVIDTFHLWFLYVLLLIYALTLILMFLFRYAIDRKGILRARMHQGFRWLMQSPYVVLFLAIPSALLLMPTTFWVGIEGYPIMLKPDWAGTFGYWLFFAVGWYLFTHLDLLSIWHRNWKRRLAMGTALSILLFAAYAGYFRVRITSIYPLVDAADLRYTPFRESLLAARNKGPDHPLYAVWDAFSPPWQTFVSEAMEPNQDEQAGLALHLSERVITATSFAHMSAWSESAIPVEAGAFSAVEAPERNRKILELLMPNAVPPPYHWFVRSTFIGKILNGRAYPYVPLRRSPLFNWRSPGVVPAHEHESGPTPHGAIPAGPVLSVAGTTADKPGT